MKKKIPAKERKMCSNFWTKVGGKYQILKVNVREGKRLHHEAEIRVSDDV